MRSHHAVLEDAESHQLAQAAAAAERRRRRAVTAALPPVRVGTGSPSHFIEMAQWQLGWHIYGMQRDY
ncbi:hypothetical protein NDU88_002872 [Pleurodeles waltl]|uniref:Uncharacterized protein n=1 Tax=Pleurodeles waltl TaxID=8319 RepID=A0AAV7UB45_PLEWA|nr:hypothetical protein NDU88_002872 [Pleurodeles waltl]